MIFKEIELTEALRIIGEGNPENNLFYYNKRNRFPDLQNYNSYDVSASGIRKCKWFIRIEEEKA